MSLDLAGLEKLLECSICLTLYTDPVTLRCGHNFCWICIDRSLDTQDWPGIYSCPECRETFRERPTLMRNITLSKVVENLWSNRGNNASIRCSYCIDTALPAVIYCLLCEASLCNNHLKDHSKEGHVLTDSSTSLESRKCSIHREILEYYCTEDATCICASCHLTGEHRGHRVETLEEASERKKLKNISNVKKKLFRKRKWTEEGVWSLEEIRRKAQEKAAGAKERATALFIDIRGQVDDLEQKVLSDISRMEKKMSQSHVIQKLKNKRDELSRKMRHVEELCNMTDPLTVLQEPDTGDLCDPDGGDEASGGHDGGDEASGGHDGGDEASGGHDGGDEASGGHDGGDEASGGHDGGDEASGGHDGGDEASGGHDGGDEATGGYAVDDGGYAVDDVERISFSLADIIRGVNVAFYVQDPEDVYLNVNTVNNYLILSDDLKTVTLTGIYKFCPETPERFQGYQVMSWGGFYSGRHYWDVDISGSGKWRVGMCYPSILREGLCSFIGYNDKSWRLSGEPMYNNQYSVIHDGFMTPLPHQISSDRVRIYVNYEAGQLSFYELCDPIRHLHTFSATFTEPLYPVIYLCDGSITMVGSSRWSAASS
ncbi:E3 ubiquitin-protein ligase TRIM58-like [Dendrobates tinctorius]|uniref:E3 ubiquitin-protein ligase TRIM58-like n=1 Tax=Dendrobates tinctorius TaxID=92724 RepID=UPI003CC95E8B